MLLSNWPNLQKDESSFNHFCKFAIFENAMKRFGPFREWNMKFIDHKNTFWKVELTVQFSNQEMDE